MPRRLLSLSPCLYPALLWCFFVNAALAGHDARLSISHVQGQCLLTWIDPIGEWVLEHSRGFQEPISWQAIAATSYSGSGNPYSHAVQPTAGSQFFRLRKLAPDSSAASGVWSLDEVTDEQSANSIPTAEDLQVSNTLRVSGRIGHGALRFNGASDVTASRAWLGNANFRTLPPTGHPFSVSFWLNPEAWTLGSRGLLGHASESGDGWQLCMHTPAPGTNYLVFAGQGSGNSLTVTGQTLLLPGQWRQVILSHNGTAGSIYLDGILLAQGTGPVSSSATPFHVGGGIGGYASFLGGIDDLRIYTNALSVEQIGLAGHWTFDENESDCSADSGIQGITAAVHPEAWSIGRTGYGADVSVHPVVIRNQNYLVLPPSGGSFSLSCWIMPHATAPGVAGLMHLGEAGINGWQMTLEHREGEPSLLQFESANRLGTLALRTPVALTNGQWSKIDLTYNGGIATLYCNGRKVGAENGAIRGSRAPLVLGAVAGLPNFQGVVDELKVYRYERGASEVGPVATTMWETCLINGQTNLVLQGAGPPGKALTYSISNTLEATNGTPILEPGTSTVTYHAAGVRGPDAFVYTVSDGEFTSVPAIVSMSVVQPHWLSPAGGSLEPLDGSSPDRAWAAGSADALDAIWKTNAYYDCFFYAPGIYETRGAKDYQRSTANSGCKHIGAGSEGPHASTIRLVDVLDPWSEEAIFSPAVRFNPSDHFEVHHLVLDCNGDNLPKFTTGLPIWIHIPLATTGFVENVTLRWNDRFIRNTISWSFGRASEYTLTARRAGTNTFLTNCVFQGGIGGVDVVAVGAEADEILLHLTRRAPAVEFYSLSEIEINGVAASRTKALQTNGEKSELYIHYPVGALTDGHFGTAWASGPEEVVEIELPLWAGSMISSLNLYWNCRSTHDQGRLGAAAQLVLRARDESTGQFHDVAFQRQGRTTSGQETIHILAGTSNVVRTDKLLLVLAAREIDIARYSLSEIILHHGMAPVPLRIPSAFLNLRWDANYDISRAFDQDLDSQWVGGYRGMIGAVGAFGNNMKFTHLRIVGFGSKATRECFPFSITPQVAAGPPIHVGNILVEKCIFTAPATNNPDGMTAVVIVPGRPNTLTNAIIRECTVSNLKPFFAYSQAFAAMHIENSIVENCDTAVYFEPDAAQDDCGPILVRSNRFVNVTSGFFIRSHPDSKFDSVVCLHNEFILNAAGGVGFANCDTCGSGPSARMTNSTILHNIIRYPDWQPRPLASDFGLMYSNTRHAVMGNNLIALGTAGALRMRQHPATTIYSAVLDDCDHPSLTPPTQSYPPSVEILPAGYKRAWFNNRSLTGDLLPIRIARFGVDGLALEQQWNEDP